MAAKRRTRKTWVQFAIATVIALIIGVVVFALIILLVNNLKSEKQTAEQAAIEQKQQLEEKINELSSKLNKKAPEAVVKEVQATTVLVAGEPITEDKLKLVELAASEKPASGSYKLISSVVGKIPALKLFPGEVITKNKVLDTDNMLPVEEGKRAISFIVNPSSLVGGSVVEGSRVDILATFDDENMTRTLLQNIRVLSVSGKSPIKNLKAKKQSSTPSKGSSSQSLLTLEVTPKEAEKLVLAKEKTKLHLTLRRFGDMNSSKSMGADLQQLAQGLDGHGARPVNPASIKSGQQLMQRYGQGLENLPAIDGPTGKTFSMEVFKGASSETQDFQSF